jgi:hypothetical protein
VEDSQRGIGETLYRLEVAGPVVASWADWFDADTITPRGENTVLEVRVSDQAELYGRLRRIHDLNLRLISLSLAGTGKPEAGPEAAITLDIEEKS